MQLATFSDKVPAAAISARDLDANFFRLRPLQSDGTNRQYLLTETPEGWSIKIFPDFPPNSGKLHVLGFQEGFLRWVPTTECA